MKKYVVLTSVIEDQDNTKEKFDEMFGLLSEIMKLVMAPRFLSEEEIDNLKKYCFSFGEKFPVTFPLRKITRKIHELIFNVPRFVMKWKTIGMLSEQEGKSKHAAVNAELRSLVCVTDHAERLRLVMEREELRASADKTMLKSKSRLCETCKQDNLRTFLRRAKDKQCHCPKCEPNFF